MSHKENMIHKSLSYNFNAHYGVSVNVAKTHVLLQVQDEYGSQTRVRLTREEVLRLIEDLKSSILEVEDNRQLPRV